MITIDHQGNRLSVAVLGEFTLGDFKEIEQAVADKNGFEGPVDLLFDLREMATFTVDMAWEEIKFTRTHGRDFGKIAVVTDSQWVTWSAWITRAISHAKLQVFDDQAEAEAWLGA